ncbi:Uncharacterised protein [Enterobacter hormaechei]|nr:Uncharacterised protein [Enterobacter hormaechei]
MCLTVCSGRAVTVTFQPVAFKGQHLSELVTLLCQFTGSDTRQMLFFQLIRQHRTTGTKCRAPFTRVTTALLLKLCFLLCGTGNCGGGVIHHAGVFKMLSSGRVQLPECRNQIVRNGRGGHVVTPQ